MKCNQSVLKKLTVKQSEVPWVKKDTITVWKNWLDIFANAHKTLQTIPNQCEANLTDFLTTLEVIETRGDQKAPRKEELLRWGDDVTFPSYMDGCFFLSSCYPAPARRPARAHCISFRHPSHLSFCTDWAFFHTVHQTIFTWESGVTF